MLTLQANLVVRAFVDLPDVAVESASSSAAKRGSLDCIAMDAPQALHVVFWRDRWRCRARRWRRRRRRRRCRAGRGPCHVPSRRSITTSNALE